MAWVSFLLYGHLLFGLKTVVVTDGINSEVGGGGGGGGGQNGWPGSVLYCMVTCLLRLL